MTSLFDDNEAERRYKEYKSKDPFPEIPPALLNSADIEDYVTVTGMIYPFDPKKLKSASYEVCFGGTVYRWDKEGKECFENIKDGQEFILEKNSIAFVYLKTKFRIPDYIALRFNLKITHVHRGILLGTGPLIDPGFEGNLLIPLHNLTSNDYKFIEGQGLIWVEFTKVSENNRWINNNSKLKRAGQYKEFPNDKRNMPAEYYFSKAAMGKSIRSSIPTAMQECKDDAEKAKESASKAAESSRRIETRVTIGGIISFVAVIIALVLGTIQVHQLVQDTIAYIKNSSNEYNTLKNYELKEIEKLKQTVINLKSEIEALKRSSQVNPSKDETRFQSKSLTP
ncbi:MAG: hypothetical protein L6Q53_00245 [Candidatus Brocadia sinica]|nr:hypothetical protein [Candidatus Brocadia sinica]NUO06931.1 hypothetical protein [Candidatus Brocadia sinica]